MQLEKNVKVSLNVSDICSTILMQEVEQAGETVKLIL